MSVYYNEFDPFAAAWLRQLMADGHLEPGTVDERSISDVEATDVRGFGRQHYFAGIGGWELALDLAGWPRERSVWTGSCPCQDFSSAGKRKGIGAERDLWPVFFRLIRECRPKCVFGEQVSSAIRFGWLDRLCADMEAEGYTVGACVLGAHSAGADHQRQRLYWVAHNQEQRFRERAADAGRVPSGVRAERLGRGPADDCAVGSMGDADEGRRGERSQRNGNPLSDTANGHPCRADASGSSDRVVWDHWRDAVTIECRDGKRRRVPAEPGLFPLAARLSGRVAVLRTGECAATPVPRQEGAEAETEETRIVSARAALHGAGNAICVQTAALFVKAFLEAESEGGGE